MVPCQHMPLSLDMAPQLDLCSVLNVWLAAQVGWKHQEAVKDLEAVRKARSSDYYAAKRKLKSLKAKATATVEERQ